MRRSLLLFLAAPILIAADDPPLIPPPIRAMLDAALASGNEGEVATIVKYARSADPASGDLVQKIADTWRSERQRARNEKIEGASPFELWAGRAELGGYLTTGNSSTFGFTGVVDLTREGLQWRHKLLLQTDYQESLGVKTREHYLASYEPNYKIDSRRYIYGAAQYESDRFLGYVDRISVSTGAGYSAIQRPTLKLDVELGPAYRYTEFTDQVIQSSAAMRGSVALAWKVTNGLTFSQNASTYLQRYNSTISSTSALGAKLIGPLSAQLSYNVQYESEPPAGRVGTDTIGRASLVYAF